jgi:hypothetical protein
MLVRFTAPGTIAEAVADVVAEPEGAGLASPASGDAVGVS